MDGDIDIILENEHTEPFKTYVLGTENYDYLESKGLDCVLVDHRPVIWDLQKEFWRHKLLILEAAMDEFDELCYLDWDCVPIKPLPDNYWDTLNEKDDIQANLQFYRRKKCHWRKTDWRKVSNGGFLYIRNKDIPGELIRTWEGMDEHHKFWDEVIISQYIDNRLGEWQGIDVYWDKFEPEVCNLKKRSAFTDEQVLSKEACFMHYIQSGNNRKETAYGGGMTS
jgi:hypothetical protein